MLWKDLCKLPNKWVMHSCHIKGCKEGYVTVGNEKLKRPKCAAPHHQLQFQNDLPTIVQCCTKYPTLGGRHKSPNRYCDEHSDINEHDDIDMITMEATVMIIHSLSVILIENF